MSERERAEQLLYNIQSRVASSAAAIDAILAFAREERAQGIEEAMQMCDKHHAKDHWYLRKLKQRFEERAKALREEGGQT